MLKNKICGLIKLHRLFIIICFILLFLLTILTNSEAAGSLKYYDKAHEIINEMQQILINREICRNVNDCNKKMIILAVWESWGIGIDVYGIKNVNILNELVGICIRHFFNNKEPFELRLDIYSHSKREMVDAPFWNKPRSTKIIMKGGVNNAER